MLFFPRKTRFYMFDWVLKALMLLFLSVADGFKNCYAKISVKQIGFHKIFTCNKSYFMKYSRETNQVS